jgi:hypothetical protein
MSVTQNPLRSLYNGDQVVNFKSKKEVQSISGYQDMASMSSWYKQDPDKYNLGLITLWGQQAMTSYPMYQELLAKKAMMEVNGDNGTFTYEIAIKDSGKCMTVRDTSAQPFAGIDNSNFKIVLNKRFAPGVVLTTDLMFGEQIIVTDEEEVRQTAEGFEHTVKMTSNDKGASYYANLLVKGIQYIKVSHSLFGEYGTNYENVDLISTPTTMTCMFQLGNMSGAEAYVTGKADRQSFSGAATATKNYLDDLMGEMDARGEYALLTDVSNIGAGGKIKSIKGMRIGSTMQMLVHREHHKSVASQLLFQKAGTVRGTNGVTKLNEGIWHQIRRGKLIQYGRPMGITRAHLKEAIEYVFRNNPNLADVDRRIQFNGGKYAVENVFEIFKAEINSQAELEGKWYGADRVLPKSPVSGSSLTELKKEAVRFTTVFIQGLGNLTIKHEPSLDNYPGADRFQKGMHQGGLAHTSYSLVIWDVADQAYSNNKQLPKGAKLVDGGDAGSNLYIVKPEGAMTYWGSENGRYDNMTATDIVSSSKYQVQSFWIYSMVAGWVKDLTRYVIIELQPSARKGFN